MKHISRLLVVASLGVSSLACSDPMGSPRREKVAVQSAESGVFIENGRSARIMYMVLDASFAARANWEPCVQANCPNVMPGERARVPAEDVPGWGESDELIVYWWHVYASPGGGFHRGSIRAVGARY